MKFPSDLVDQINSARSSVTAAASVPVAEEGFVANEKYLVSFIYLFIFCYSLLVYGFGSNFGAYYGILLVES